MAETQALVQTLKKTLKANGLTYRRVAEGLGLSEASVKRLFSEESFSLRRLDQVCGLMGLEISDLVRQMEAERREQEERDRPREAVPGTVRRRMGCGSRSRRAPGCWKLRSARSRRANARPMPYSSWGGRSPRLTSGVPST